MNQETKALYEKMSSRLEKVVPDVELRYKAELAVEINARKKEKNAVILGHNYMEPALYYSIPDFVGDSLELSRKAAQTDKDVIVFLGISPRNLDGASVRVLAHHGVGARGEAEAEAGIE